VHFGEPHIFINFSIFFTTKIFDIFQKAIKIIILLSSIHFICHFAIFILFYRTFYYHISAATIILHIFM